jgi:hypothetical protein
MTKSCSTHRSKASRNPAAPSTEWKAFWARCLRLASSASSLSCSFSSRATSPLRFL